ncbi:MAG TPA: D-aminoacyl-tRNA deacylase [Candidatus Binataceae bacterium]|nr:D-aminoacyl-tRNA deacylase [Candidatus Binataceae bacterium]
MRAVVQRVSRAQVSIDGRIAGRIGLGYLVSIGVAREDSEADAELLARKILALRVFADEAGKMNLALDKIGGEMLVVSQFTLLADTNAGRRPSFINAAEPGEARRLYEHFVEIVRRTGTKVETGEFGAMMAVELVNDGPVTILFDTRER